MDNIFDIIILTDSRYLHPKAGDAYTQNVLTEDTLVLEALQRKGLKVSRTHWDKPDFDWSCTRYALFRTTWDYFDRFDEFSSWLDRISKQTRFINPLPLIRWNIDKHYLDELQAKGIRIPPTIFIKTGEHRSLREIAAESGWSEYILKPAVSGAARHTYRINKDNIDQHETIFQDLIAKEALLLQEFQQSIFSQGELAFMLFNGRYSHTVLKKGKAGDFRVQDDFGGTVHSYKPSAAEIDFAEQVVSLCTPRPVYARVDMIWDHNNRLCVSELELIEPELWFRKRPEAADQLAEGIVKRFGAHFK